MSGKKSGEKTGNFEVEDKWQPCTCIIITVNHSLLTGSKVCFFKFKYVCKS